MMKGWLEKLPEPQLCKIMTVIKKLKKDVHNDHLQSIGNHATKDYGQRTTDPETWLSIDFERIDYRKAWALQEELVTARRTGSLQKDIVLFLEHPPVFTLGRRGGRECMLVSDAFLEKAGIPIIQVERGGTITYHGPGQLVAYPIVDLQSARIKVVDFVSGLEDIMLQTAKNWGIAAERNDANRGIWVGEKKMGSIGIAVRRGISFHGLALNVQTDLTPFGWIQPCGLQDVGMTSMQLESAQPLSMQQVSTDIKKQFERVFGIQLVQKSRFDLDSILENVA
jgi:lipoate-protein ligase B